MEPILIIIVINSILTGILLVLFFRYLLNKNLLKNAGITNVDTEDIIKRTNKQEIVLCFLGFISAILICIIGSTDLISSIFSIVIALIVVISIILKKVMKVKIANKMCFVSVVILAVVFFIKPIYYSNHTINDGCDNDFEITSFNTRFTQYEGEKTGSQVKTLLQEIISTNSNPENEDRLVSVEFLDKKGNPMKGVSLDKTKIIGSNAIKKNEKYIVEFEYNGEGNINKCIITQVKNN